MRWLCDVWHRWHGTARPGTAARAAPASRGASQRHPGGSCAGCATHSSPLAPASPPFAVAVSACGVAISACGVLTFRSAPPRAPANRGRARGRRLRRWTQTHEN